MTTKIRPDIRHVKVTEAVQDYALLRGQRAEKDDIHIFTQLFETAAKSYTQLNEAEQDEFRKIVIARH